MELSKELPEFIALSQQFSRDMEQKDKETSMRKKRKYQRDIKNFEDDLVFKWQKKTEETVIESNNSSPEKEVRIIDNQNEGRNVQHTRKL